MSNIQELTSATAIAPRVSWKANPFLHLDPDRFYNPLTDRTLTPSDPHFGLMNAFLFDGVYDPALERDGWIIDGDRDLSRQFRLKIVSLETMTTCNQRCYFCPVSVAPREDETMPPELFDDILGQLTAFRDTIEGVFLQSYNEPSIDRRFVDFCTRLFRAGLPVAVLSNGSGLTPAKIDALLAAGTLRYLCINLSTLDHHRYQADRGEDHLEVVLRNLDAMKNRPVASEMKIIVLGLKDAVHDADYDAIRLRFAGTRFKVEQHLVNDRASYLDVGMKTMEKKQHLAGCELIGSRPLQHLHITPKGTCILCCQDYDENYVVGDLRQNSVLEVLQGPEMAKMRRWTYGIEESPDDFICRTCVWARTR